ncbi:MAG TPA: hypothetical protein VFP61_07700 [Acidimicrobiales bacterium]|nr:hypothetical protein [Acidimicrobiales bacterium]
MDLLDRRIARRLARDLGLAEADVVDFEIGTSRPLVALPHPLPTDLAEQAQVEVVLTVDALHLRVVSRSHRGEATALPWARVRTFGAAKAEGRWRRWSLRGELSGPTEAVVVSLTGRPRPSFLLALADLGVDPPDVSGDAPA